MPKPREARGRRNKRKLEDDPEDAAAEQSVKRQRSEDEGGEQDFHALETNGDDVTAAYPPMEKVFFGMLDEQEQEYFKRADEMLEADSFGDAEERKLFLAAVHREADGKELKIAHSQSCSRLMERLIARSTSSQLKHVFQKFSGNFIHLITHRFASHCCEALFTHAASVVDQEVRNPRKTAAPLSDDDPNQVHVSMENLFLHTLAELGGNVGYLMTNPYASHTLRLLLLIFSGDSISTDAMKSLLRSRKKETITISGAQKQADEDKKEEKARAIPKSFSTALEKLLGESVAGLDTVSLRALSTHPTASPTLQLLLKLEMTLYGKQRAKDEKSIIRTLLPDDPFTPDCESAAYISGLVYDPVGAHLVERIIENAPAKLFKSLYNTFFKERLTSYARNEIATYVDCRIIERLGYDDLLEAHQCIVPLISPLLDNSWTALVRTLIERCTVRDIDTQAIAAQIDQTWRTSDRFDIERMLLVHQKPTLMNGGPVQTNGAPSTEAAQHPGAASVSGSSDLNKVRMNVFAQALLIVPGSLSALILDSLIELEPINLISLAKDSVTSRTLQAALTTRNASMIQRRKLVQRFYGSIGDMSVDTAASHLVDCIWKGTHGLAFIRERIAEELAENEAQLRETACGRAVWKNWKMDLYKRRRGEWVFQSKIKASNDGFQSFSELDSKNDSGAKKTPLEQARERHMKRQQKAPTTKSPTDGPKRSSRKGSAGSSSASAVAGLASAST